MNQLAFDLAVSRKHTALIFVQAKPELFRCDFAEYLDANFQVYLLFEKRALTLWNAGRRRYGHRSIWEVLRYETAAREVDGEYKLNDHYTKSIARLFEFMNKNCVGMFEFREREAA